MIQITVVTAGSIPLYLNVLFEVEDNTSLPESRNKACQEKLEDRASPRRTPPEGAATLAGGTWPSSPQSAQRTSSQHGSVEWAAFELYVQMQSDKVSFLLPLALRCCAYAFPWWFCRKQGLICVTVCRFLQFEHKSGGDLSGSRWTLGRCGLERDTVLPVSSARARAAVGARPSSRSCVIKLVQACRPPITNQVKGLIFFLPATEMSLLRGVCVGHFPTLHRSIGLQQILFSSGHSGLLLLCAADGSSPPPAVFVSLGGVV